MKKIILPITFFAMVSIAFAQDTTPTKFNDTLILQNIEVTSVRASDKAPFTKTNLSREQIEERNLGYDLPQILEQTPSVVAGSDAGNGVGYTNIRIRGSDATRINVTLNGIPYNDAESQGTFFVNMPDIASSVNSIQIQRGVGTSSNGSGAFGASINLSTNEVNKENYLELNNSFGSFNTWKNTIRAGTGLIKDHFTFDARLSNITSDGYIDRASTDLKSYYASAAYLAKKTSIRFNLISGKEKTYQAWNGVPQSLLATDRTYNSAGMDKPGTPYQDETDNYHQTHYQLFLNQKLHDRISFSVAGFLVRGKGYYENYKSAQKYKKYLRPNVINGTDTIERTDLVLQRWLDNYFYGSVFSGQYASGRTHITFGGAYTRYDGDHFNRVIWADKGGFPPNYSSYTLPAHKNDFNLYVKWMQAIGSGFNLFLDLQQRLVNYEINGFKDHPDIHIDKQYSFFNPKLGVSWLRDGVQAYASFSAAAKEPNRKDFEAGITDIPKPERLYDWEAGLSYRSSALSAGLNLYYMDYVDQLVNTGRVNDVGAFTRQNADKSYRAGIEIEAAYQPWSWLQLQANSAFSKNKISHFTEYIYDENYQPTENRFENTDISFSPNVVAGGSVHVMPVPQFRLSLISKYVGAQFLDNTSNPDRMLAAYFVEDARVEYTLERKPVKEIKILFQVNNVFDRKYESNGHTYNYIDKGTLYVENYYFPMAGINFMAGLNISF